MLEKYKKILVNFFEPTKVEKVIVDENTEIIHKMRSVYCGEDGKNMYWACCDYKNIVYEESLGPDEKVNCRDCLRIMGRR